MSEEHPPPDAEEEEPDSQSLGMACHKCGSKKLRFLDKDEAVKLKAEHPTPPPKKEGCLVALLTRVIDKVIHARTDTSYILMDPLATLTAVTATASTVITVLQYRNSRKEKDVLAVCEECGHWEKL